MSVLSAWTSSLTPTATLVRTRFSRPTRFPLPEPLPLAPFPPLAFSLFPSFPFLSAINFLWRSQIFPVLNAGQKCAWVIKVRGLSFRPLIQAAHIHQDLTIGRDIHVRSVHRPRRRPFEVDSFTVVTTAVTRTLEFVLRRLPVGRAAQVGAARINHEQPVWCAIHPDAIFLLELR